MAKIKRTKGQTTFISDTWKEDESLSNESN
jgi:hypothetical protein